MVKDIPRPKKEKATIVKPVSMPVELWVEWQQALKERKKQHIKFSHFVQGQMNRFISGKDQLEKHVDSVIEQHEELKTFHDLAKQRANRMTARVIKLEEEIKQFKGGI